jgi:hypothetical protein
MIRQAAFYLAVFAGLTGCTYVVPVTSTDAYNVPHCVYIGTFEEINNPGQVSFGTLKHYLDTTGVEYRVKRRAYASGATHLVWLYNHSEAAGAMAYDCPAGEAPLTRPMAARNPVTSSRR